MNTGHPGRTLRIMNSVKSALTSHILFIIVLNACTIQTCHSVGHYSRVQCVCIVCLAWAVFMRLCKHTTYVMLTMSRSRCRNRYCAIDTPPIVCGMCIVYPLCHCVRVFHVVVDAVSPLRRRRSTNYATYAYNAIITHSRFKNVRTQVVWNVNLRISMPYWMYIKLCLVMLESRPRNK